MYFNKISWDSSQRGQGSTDTTDAGPVTNFRSAPVGPVVHGEQVLTGPWAYDPLTIENFHKCSVCVFFNTNPQLIRKASQSCQIKWFSLEKDSIFAHSNEPSSPLPLKHLSNGNAVITFLNLV